jgi:hypothetical protein
LSTAGALRGFQIPDSRQLQILQKVTKEKKEKKNVISYLLSVIWAAAREKPRGAARIPDSKFQIPDSRFKIVRGAERFADSRFKIGASRVIGYSLFVCFS